MSNYDIGAGVCNECCDENNWLQSVNEQINAIDNRWGDGKKTFLANDPIWTTYKEIWKQYFTACLIVEYDCCTVYLCRNHLERIITILKEAE